MSDQIFNLSPFMGGLNTELTKTAEAPLNTSEELNCTIYPETIRGRRYGMALERDGRWAVKWNEQHIGGTLSNPHEYYPEGTTYGGFFWKNVDKTDRDVIVYQVDKQLYFFEAIKPFSQQKPIAKVSLWNYLIDVNLFSQYPVNFTTGDGKLMVVSKYMKPIYITLGVDNTTTVTEIHLKYRDLDGVDDGLSIEEMPKTLSKAHSYNLSNQGWTTGTINEFFNSQKTYPSNNLQWFVGKDSSGKYSTEKLLQTYFGNSRAPRGHYILDYFERKRSSAAGIWVGDPKKFSYTYHNSYVKNRSIRGTPVQTFWKEFENTAGIATNLHVEFAELKGKIAKKSMGDWRGKVTFVVQGLKNGKWVKLKEYFDTFFGKSYATIEWQNETSYDRYRVQVTFDRGTNAASDIPYPLWLNVTFSLPLGSDGDAFPYTGPEWRVTDVDFMSGKYFYLAGDTVLFSQTVTEDNNGYNLCYQDADPTSEEISDVLETDGGFVKFQTMGDGVALKTFNRGVLVFGRDVVYGLLSPNDGRFTALDYDTVELSRAGIIGAKSPVSTGNDVYYWSPLGIFRIGVNMNTGSSMVAENITQNTIQSFYNNIPEYSKQHCRGAFDYSNNRIYWYYPLNPEKYWRLDGVLVLDLNYGAFMPFKISEGGAVVDVFQTLISYQVTPTMYVRANGARVVAGTENYPLYVYDITTENFTTKIYFKEKPAFNTSTGEFFIKDDKGVLVNDKPRLSPNTSLVTVTIKEDGTVTCGINHSPLEYITDEEGTYTASEETYYAYENEDEGHYVLAREQTNDYDRYTAIQHCVIDMKRESASFGDYNSREFIDWDKYPYESFMVSRPIMYETYGNFGGTVSGTYENKQVPILQTLFKRTEEDYTTVKHKYIAQSGAYLRMRWGWSTHYHSNRWDLIQNAYRPQKDFMHDSYVESRIHIRGRGKSYQIEIRNDANKDFRLAGINILVRRP